MKISPRIWAGLIAIGVCFVLIGCTQFYRTIGLTDRQATTQVAEDQAVAIRVIESGRELLWQVISVAVAGVGAVLTGLLGRWLGTERKMTRAMIRGIEATTSDKVKASVQAMARAAGVEGKLHKRVRALTG